MSSSLHKTWLKVTAVVVASFAPLLFLGTMPATSAPAAFVLDLLSWPINGTAVLQSSDGRLLSAILGGVTLGWGVMIWILSGEAYDKAPEPIRKAVVVSFLAWFVFDGMGSVASGNALNAVFNLVILLLAVGPLWRKA